MDLGDSESYLLSFYVNPLSHTMKGILNLVVSVVAGVLVYYICKWLDKRFNTPRARIPPPL